MTTSSIHSLIDGRTTPELVLWGIVFIAIIAGIGAVLWFEQQRFRALGKGQSWLRLRLLSLPILAITACLVWLPAKAISGPMALAYFYTALLTLAPLSWFGLHWLAGHLLSPRLPRPESMSVALTGLAILVFPPLLTSILQGPMYTVSLRYKQSTLAKAKTVPLAHKVLPMQRFRLGDQGEIFTQTLSAGEAPPLERIDSLIGGHGHDSRTSTHSFFCRQGDDLHLAWSADSPPPPLRLYWYDADKNLVMAEYQIDGEATKQLPAQEFSVNWRKDGLDFPAPLSREVVQLGWADKAGKLFYRSLNSLQPGENFDNNCVMAGYRRLAWQEEGPVVGVLLAFAGKPPGRIWQHEIKR